MTRSYRLHYAPDNASLIVRLAMDEMDVPYHTVLVDRRVQGQCAPDYLKLNPNGLIPVLETPDGPIFETGAILLWLADRHGAMAPAPDHLERGAFLKWLFFVSNTLHADMRITFYTHLYAGPDEDVADTVRRTVQQRLAVHLRNLDELAATRPGFFAAPDPSVLDYYVACAMRWMALYPIAHDRQWFSLDATPHLKDMLAGLQTRAAVKRAIVAEGLGPLPFTKPDYPQPPEGSAT